MSLGLGLLQKLASGLTPVGNEKPAKGLAGADPTALSFGELLNKAQKGEINSGLPVTVAKGADVELTDDQLSRVAIAADRAQAAGADRAIVIVDDIALHLDVATRTISGKAQLTPGVTVSGIDAVVTAPGTPSQAEAAAQKAATGLANSAPANSSLLEVLAKRDKNGPDSSK